MGWTVRPTRELIKPTACRPSSFSRYMTRRRRVQPDERFLWNLPELLQGWCRFLSHIELTNATPRQANQSQPGPIIAPTRILREVASMHQFAAIR